MCAYFLWTWQDTSILLVFNQSINQSFQVHLHNEGRLQWSNTIHPFPSCTIRSTTVCPSPDVIFLLVLLSTSRSLFFAVSPQYGFNKPVMFLSETEICHFFKAICSLFIPSFIPVNAPQLPTPNSVYPHLQSRISIFELCVQCSGFYTF